MLGLNVVGLNEGMLGLNDGILGLIEGILNEGKLKKRSKSSNSSFWTLSSGLLISDVAFIDIKMAIKSNRVIFILIFI